MREARPAGAGRHDLIETSERLATLLAGARIPHEVLNAKQHEREATSSPRPGGPARSPSRPTWPAAARTSCSGQPPDADRRNRESSEAELSQIRELAEAPRPGARRRRPAHHRHQKARVAAHRQQLRGRSGRQGDRVEPFLSVPRGQPDAHLRRPDAHEGADDARRHEARGGDRERHAHAADRARPAARRTAQFRCPQAAAGIRRRRE